MSGSTSEPAPLELLQRLIKHMDTQPRLEETRLMIWYDIIQPEIRKRRQDVTFWRGTGMDSHESRDKYMNFQPLQVEKVEQGGGNLGYQRALFNSVSRYVLELLLPLKLSPSIHHKAMEEYRHTWRTKICFIYVLEECDEEFDVKRHPESDENIDSERPERETERFYLYPSKTFGRDLISGQPYGLKVDKSKSAMEQRFESLANPKYFEFHYSLMFLYRISVFQLQTFYGKTASERAQLIAQATPDNALHFYQEMKEIIELRQRLPHVSLDLVLTELPNEPRHSNQRYMESNAKGLTYYTHSHAWCTVLFLFERACLNQDPENRLRLVYRARDEEHENGYREVQLLPDPLMDVMRATSAKNIPKSTRGGSPSALVYTGGFWHAHKSPWMKNSIVKILELHGIPYEDNCDHCRDPEEPSMTPPS